VLLAGADGAIEKPLPTLASAAPGGPGHALKRDLAFADARNYIVKSIH
jgi:hypothetical protein